MSHHLDQTIADAATNNLSFAATLERLADLELEYPLHSHTDLNLHRTGDLTICKTVRTEIDAFPLSGR
jgi:hypothetical protein